MAGLLGFTLADLSGAVDSRKRQYANLVRGLLSDPGATLAQLAAVDAEAARGNRYTQASASSVMPEVAQQGQEAMLNAALNVGGLLGATKHSLPGKLFHGSPHKGLDKLTLDDYGATTPGLFGKGIYLTESRGYAGGYGGGAYGRDAGSVYEVAHSLKNPYIWPSKDAIKAGAAGDSKVLAGAQGPEDITTALQAAGHDGVVVLAKSPKRGIYAHEVVVFDPAATAVLGVAP